MFIDEEAHGHHGDAAALDRDDPLLISTPLDFGCLICHAEHRRCVGSVDVCIEQSDPQSLLRQSAGQIDGHGALADAALAAADGDHLTHPWNRLAFSGLTMARLADSPLAGR